MQKFKFNLESVLGYRQAKEEEAKLQLATANAREAQKRNALANYQLQLASEQERPAGEDLKIINAIHREIYMESLNKRIEQQQLEVNQARAEVLRCQRSVTQARKETMVLDHIKARRYQEYYYELERQEQKMMDEISLAGFVRRTKE